METADILWVTFAAVLVLLMQAAFLCVESGLTRSKNSINVAMKNVVDFALAISLFWLLGFGVAFGETEAGWFGASMFAPDFSSEPAELAVVFLFQAVFCATAATIVAGAIAERTRFFAYVTMAILVVALIYPVFVHWAWGGAVTGQSGWLQARGFVDFAGSTVVHSVGGWVALAAVLIVGPRSGRFVDGEVRTIPPSNMPLAMLGLLLFVVGWIGFNGGSTLALNDSVPSIVANTVLAATVGSAVALVLPRFLRVTMDPASLCICGGIAGMVAVTAGCHAFSAAQSVFVAAVGTIVMVLVDRLLTSWRIDDAVAAIPVHLGAGAWGTLATGIIGDLETLGTGLSRSEQVIVQLQGILACGAWSFGVALVLLFIFNRRRPMRIDPDGERMGLNVAEHGIKTAMIELMEVMEEQRQTGDLSRRAPEEPFTEVGQIAACYNRVLQALDDSGRFTRRIVRNLMDGVMTFDQAGLVTSANPGAERLLGCRSQDLLGRSLAALYDLAWLEPVGAPGSMGPVGRRVEDPLHLDRREFLRVAPDGSKTYLEFTSGAVAGNRGGTREVTAVVRDVTERRRLEDTLLREKERAEVTLASIADGVITTSTKGEIEYLNDVAVSLLGTRLSAATGQLLDEVMLLHDEATASPIRLGSLVQQGRVREIERFQNLRLSRAAGEFISVNLSMAPIGGRGSPVSGMVVTFQDVTASRALEKQLAHQATHDSLTGLLNRSEFDRRLAEHLADARVDGTRHVLGYLDLDQFKIVNDTAGHFAGDELIRMVAWLVDDQLRGSDTLARLGGDEFGFLLRNCDIQRGTEIAEKIRAAIDEFRFHWEGATFSIGSCIGLVPVTGQNESSQELLGMADAACYAAKDGGRNRVHKHLPNDAELNQRRGQMEWATRVKDSLDRDRFRLYFQPIVPADPDSTLPSHFEIFIRMLDEDDTPISPGAFIPAAERYDMMSAIDHWVVSNTLAWLGGASNPAIRVAINLSGPSITDANMYELIRSQFARYGVKAEQVCFEITETAAVSDLTKARRFIEELRALGCGFALDDFGSGLSSFGYLKSLPVDYLKIDGMFVRDMLRDPIDRAMVESINNVGHLVGLRTVAEFVENSATLEMLRKIGVDYAQGYHIAEPKPLTELESVTLMPR